MKKLKKLWGMYCETYMYMTCYTYTYPRINK